MALWYLWGGHEGVLGTLTPVLGSPLPARITFYIRDIDPTQIGAATFAFYGFVGGNLDE